METVITFGTFDLFHYGHLKILQRAAALGPRLIVGVSSDKLNMLKKNILPEYPEDHRMEIVAAMSCVDEVFLEESLELKRVYLQKYCADILVMGDDWDGRFDSCSDICEVVYLPRTKNISTTYFKEKIRSSS